MRHMKKRLTLEQFQEAIKGLEVGERTLEIARAVLVEGMSQAKFAADLHISKGAISQSVNRVWAAHEAKSLPEGYERVSAILPKHQAFQVKKWAMEAQRKLQRQK